MTSNLFGDVVKEARSRKKNWKEVVDNFIDLSKGGTRTFLATSTRENEKLKLDWKVLIN